MRVFRSAYPVSASWVAQVAAKGSAVRPKDPGTGSAQRPPGGPYAPGSNVHLGDVASAVAAIRPSKAHTHDARWHPEVGARTRINEETDFDGGLAGPATDRKAHMHRCRAGSCLKRRRQCSRTTGKERYMD